MPSSVIDSAYPGKRKIESSQANYLQTVPIASFKLSAEGMANGKIR